MSISLEPILNRVQNRTFWVLIIGSLNNRYTNTKLNGAKICKNRAARSSGTGTTLTGTSTSPLLPVGTGTGLSGTGTTCPLHHGYQYHFLVPVPISDF